MTRNPPKYRRMVEQRLGRPLRKKADRDPELVHHVNGDPTDNRWENLVVCSGGEHRWMHDGNRVVLAKCRLRQGWGFTAEDRKALEAENLRIIHDHMTTIRWHIERALAAATS